MKKFIFNILFFFSLIFILSFSICCINIPDDYIIHKTKGTAFQKIAWNLNYFNRIPEKITGSVLFVGPSLIQAGICDSTLKSNSINAINLGNNGAGNELKLYFLNRVLKFKPAKVYIHTYKGKHKELHSMTPILYNPFNLYSSGQSINYYYLKFLYKRTFFVIDYLTRYDAETNLDNSSYSEYGSIKENESISKEQYSLIELKETTDFFESFHIHENNFTKSAESKRDGIYFMILRLRRQLIYSINNSDFLNNTVSQVNFEKKSFELCSNSNVPAEYFYMPIVADAKINLNFDNKFYDLSTNTNVRSLNNFNFLDSSLYWFDMTHLSKKGAIAFTKELISQKVITP